MGGHDVRHHGLAVRGVGDVEAVRLGAGDAARHGGGGVGVDVAHDHVVAAGAQFARDGGADPRTGSGDGGDGLTHDVLLASECEMTVVTWPSWRNCW